MIEDPAATRPERLPIEAAGDARRPGGRPTSRPPNRRLAHLDRYFTRPVMREALAHLIANLGAGGAGPSGRIGLAAATHGEGVTTLALYLGLEIVNTFSVPVLVVEANFRRPRLATYTRVHQGPGLKELLKTRGLALADVVQKSGRPDLHLLPAGGVHSHPYGLIAADQFERRLRQAGERYAVVLVDTPPLLPYAEGPAILRALAKTALVVAADATRVGTVRQAVAALEHQGIELTGTVLNRRR